MNFSQYQTNEFRKLLENVYDFSSIQVAGVDFYRSNKKIRNDDLFNTPFGYFSTSVLTEAQWAEIKTYSETHSVNIRFVSASELPFISNRKTICHCPIVALPKSFDELRQGFSSNLRSNINKLQNKVSAENVFVKKGETLAELKSFYDVILAHEYVKKHRMIFQPFGLFERLVFDLRVADFYLAFQSTELLGGIILTKDGSVLHYNWGASRKHKNVPIGILLIIETMKVAIEQGYTHYDLGGTPLSDDELFSFKMRFGSKNYPIYEYFTLRESTTPDMNKDMLFARKVYSLLPPKLAGLMMPHVVPWLMR